MNETSSPYETPKTNLEAGGAEPPKASVLVICITVILVLINLFLAFVLGAAKGEFSGNIAGLVGYAMGSALMMPVIFVGIGSIWKRYRNKRSQTKILMWGSVLVLFSHIGNFANLAAQLPK